MCQQEAGRIGEVEDARPHGLQRRRLRHVQIVFLDKTGRLDVLPPLVCVFHHQVHHEVPRMSFT